MTGQESLVLLESIERTIARMSRIIEEIEAKRTQQREGDDIG